MILKLYDKFIYNLSLTVKHTDSQQWCRSPGGHPSGACPEGAWAGLKKTFKDLKKDFQKLRSIGTVPGTDKFLKRHQVLY